jgi:hypothetical protein
MTATAKVALTLPPKGTTIVEFLLETTAFDRLSIVSKDGQARSSIFLLLCWNN